MRNAPLRAALFGLLLLAGCEVGDTSGPGGDGDGDDGITGVDAQVIEEPDPTLSASLDRTAIMTELGSESMVTLTLTGGEGFVGDVAVAASAVDPAGAPLVGWVVELSDSTVTLTENGTATVVATVKIPTVNSGLTGKVKFQVTSTLVAPIVTESAMTVLDQVSIAITRSGGGNGCQYPAGMTTTRVKVGTKVRFVNADADPADLMAIHTGLPGRDANVGIPHQNADMGPGEAYERTTTAPGLLGWYCHTPGNNPDNLNIEVIE